MTNGTDPVSRIRSASSLEEIRDVVREFSAKSSREGGILYSRNVGDVPSEVIAKGLSKETGLPIINDTPRARFLVDAQDDIATAAERIFRSQGQSLEIAQNSKMSFLFGDPKAPAHSLTSLEGSLWGDASREFAESLSGDIKVVASNANIERVFGKVELPAILENPNVRTLGGQPVDGLKALYSQGGADAVLPKVQAQFIDAAPQGIFVAEGLDGKVTRISLSREFADAMDVPLGELNKFPTTAELTNKGISRAPISLGAAAGDAALSAEAAAMRGLSPGTRTFLKGAGAAGVAVLAYDVATTGHQVVQLRAQGNATGADSAATHFVGRNVGGIAGGFLVGAGYGLATGSWTGPGAIATTLVGGVAGAVVGEQWARDKDNDRIHLQTDSHGNEWRRDPDDPTGKWTRSADTQQIKVTTTEPLSSPTAVDVEVKPASAPGSNDPRFLEQRYVAAGNLERELNNKAANASYELGLANPHRPESPYRLEPNESDKGVLPRGGKWTRDLQTGNWSYNYEEFIEHGMSVTHSVPAQPERATQLEEQSKLVIAQNAANTPAAVAARYQIAYSQFGWQIKSEAVRNAAANPHVIQASDGETYTRQPGGEWTTPGVIYGTNHADGAIRNELDAVYDSQTSGLEAMREIAEYAEANRQPEQDPVRLMVAAAYESANVTRTEAELNAAADAVRRNHERDGVATSFTLRLLPDPRTGAFTTESAIATFASDPDGNMVQKSLTQADQIQNTSDDAPARSEKTSLPAVPGITPSPPPSPSTPTPAHDDVRADGERKADSVSVSAAALLADNPSHPDHATFNRIHTWVRSTGQWDEDKSRNIASALYKEQAADPLVQRVDKVAGALGKDGEESVFAVYAPHGDKGPFFHASVDGRLAAQQPAEQSLEQAEQIRQQHAQQQQLDQQQSQQQSQRNAQQGM